MAIRDRASQPLPFSLAAGAPADVSVVQATSGNVADAVAVVTLASAAGKVVHITGFQATATGSTAGVKVNVTVAGLAGGTATYAFTFPANTAVAATPLIVQFPVPLPASGSGVDIIVTLPAGGAGNTHSAVCAQGFLI